MKVELSKDKIYLFEEMPVKKAVLRLSVPTVLSMLVAVFYNLADTYFVSLLDDPVETAAVTLIGTLILLFNAIINIFGIGGSSAFSRALGAKDSDRAKQSTLFSIYGCIFCAVLLSLFTMSFKPFVLNALGADEFNSFACSKYMFWAVTLGAVPAILNTVVGQIIKGEGNAAHASIGMMSGCILNVILDPFFILPQFLNMGAEGAGLATFISNCFACLYYIVLVVIINKGKTLVSFNVTKLRVTKDLVVDICSVGVPAAIQNILNVTGATIMNNYAAVYGSTCVSAVGIAHKMCNLSLYIAMGISSGVTPLISYNYASGASKRMKEVIMCVMRTVIPLMLVMMVGMVTLSDKIMTLFMDNEEVVKYGGVYIKEMAIAQPFLAFDFTAVGLFNAIGRGRYAFVFAVLRKIILEIPALYILNKIYPIYGIGYAQTIAEIVLACIAFVMIKRILRELNI